MGLQEPDNADFSKILELLERSRKLRKAAQSLNDEADRLRRIVAWIQMPEKETVHDDREAEVA